MQLCSMHMEMEEPAAAAVTVAVRGCGGGARVLSLLRADFAVLVVAARVPGSGLGGHAEAVGDDGIKDGERRESRRLLERRWNGQAALGLWLWAPQIIKF
jgi:hypothetical protein